MHRINILTFTLVLFFLSAATISTGQTISRKTKGIVADLAKKNEVHCPRIGHVGSPSPQFKTYEQLCEIATDAELIALAQNSNETVRCYAFQCLANRPQVNLFPILIEHLSDNNSVVTFCGCIQRKILVGDYFIQVITNNKNGSGKYALSDSQRVVLDSTLLFQKGITLAAKNRLLREIKPETKYHSRIRQIAISENTAVAALALARFRDTADIETIKKFFNGEVSEYYAIYSAKEFPVSTFYPLLVKIFEKEWRDKYYDYQIWRILFQALAKYPQQQTFELFRRATEAKDNFRYQTLCTYLTIALTKYPNTLFEPLKEKIKLDQYHSNEVQEQMNYED